MFLSVALCMAVAVVLLVVKPIQEALEAGGDCGVHEFLQRRTPASAAAEEREREQEPAL